MNEVSTTYVRPQPIRDAIIAYLSVPRLARDIALHINRPVPVATGHLAAMQRRGPAKRIGYAVYAPPDWPEAAEAFSALARSQPARAEILEYLTEPRTLREIALHVNHSRQTAATHLAAMHKRGLVKNLGSGVYALADSPPEPPMANASSQPIRDAILRYLTEPRFVREIALHLDQPVLTVTGHLSAMQRRGLIRRVGPGVYAPLDSPIPAEPAGAPVTPGPSRTRSGSQSAAHRCACALLTGPRNIQSLRLETGLPGADVAAGLNALWLAGLVAGDESKLYRLTAGGRRVYSVNEAAPAMSADGVTRSSGARVRPPRIRDAILPHLTEPRSMRDIALHMYQPLRTASRHLATLRRQGLIRCIGRGVYAKIDSRVAGPMSKPAQPVQPRALCQRLAPLLTWRRSVQGLSLETGLKKTAIAAALNELWLHGLVSGDAASGYRLTAAGARKYSVSVPEDAVSDLPRADAVSPRAVRRALG